MVPHRLGPPDRCYGAGPNFASTAFWELRLTEILGSSPPALCIEPVLCDGASYVQNGSNVDHFT